MSATGRNQDERRKRDYYVTPKNHIRRFLDRALEHFPDLLTGGTILDPCAGGDKDHEMRYPSVIKEYQHVEPILTWDIREDSKADRITDYLTTPAPPVNTIITNPPFRHTLAIIQKALHEDLEDGYLVLLTRLNFLGSQKRRGFWHHHLPRRIYVHPQRPSFTEDGGTDATEYMHVVWEKGFFSKPAKLEVL